MNARTAAHRDGIAYSREDDQTMATAASVDEPQNHNVQQKELVRTKHVSRIQFIESPGTSKTNYVVWIYIHIV